MTNKIKSTVIIIAVLTIAILAFGINERTNVNVRESENAISGFAKLEETTQTSNTTQETSTTAKTTYTTITTTVIATTTTQEYISLDEVSISIDMDISKPTGLSEKDFTVLMNNLNCDYAGYFKRNAKFIWNQCQMNKVNEIAVCGIIGQESGWATIAGWGQNNFFGIAGGNYLSEEDGIKSFIELLSKQYLSEDGAYYNGSTLSDIGVCYCDPYDWPQDVYRCMEMVIK